MAQIIWNIQHGFAPEEGINEYDLVYFDPANLSAEAELGVKERVADLVSGVSIVWDVKNEARVHLWYEEKVERALEPYNSSEEAMSTWPTTASSVGVRQRGQSFSVCAPFGLSDLLGMVVRPNKTLVSQEIFAAKAERWRSRWPMLRLIPW